MQFTSVSSVEKRKKADALVVPFWKDGDHPKPAAKLGDISKLVSAPVTLGDFTGSCGEVAFFYLDGKTESRAILIGLGKKEECTPYDLQAAYASIVKACRKSKVGKINLLLPEVKDLAPERVLRACTEGLLINNYVFEQLKRKHDPANRLQEGCWVGVAPKFAKLAQKWAKIDESASYTRDMQNGNADDVTAAYLSDRARELAKKHSTVKTTIFGQSKLEKEKMGLMLAVNRGSANEPALIMVEYQGDPKSKDVTAIVGKGITYDTGGLNIKPTGSMETMKTDMSAGAAVLGTMRAIIDLGLKVNVVGVVAACENCVDAKSYKPGDVYIGHAGKSVEIGNTDAEGRLVLADALSYVSSTLKPSRIIDLATLTGAMVISLGEEIAGVMCDDDKLAGQLLEAGDRTSELLWRQPLPKMYKKRLKSDVADVSNTAGRPGSALTAGLFLQHFVDPNIPWAHLDIAGVGYTDKPEGCHSQRATGFGVRLLVDFLEHL